MELKYEIALQVIKYLNFTTEEEYIEDAKEHKQMPTLEELKKYLKENDFNKIIKIAEETV